MGLPAPLACIPSLLFSQQLCKSLTFLQFVLFSLKGNIQNAIAQWSIQCQSNLMDLSRVVAQSERQWSPLNWNQFIQPISSLCCFELCRSSCIMEVEHVYGVCSNCAVFRHKPIRITRVWLCRWDTYERYIWRFRERFAIQGSRSFVCDSHKHLAWKEVLISCVVRCRKKTPKSGTEWQWKVVVSQLLAIWPQTSVNSMWLFDRDCCESASVVLMILWGWHSEAHSPHGVFSTCYHLTQTWTRGSRLIRTNNTEWKSFDLGKYPNKHAE